MSYEYGEQLALTGEDAFVSIEDERLVIWGEGPEGDEASLSAAGREEIRKARARYYRDRYPTLTEYNAAGRFLFGEHWEPLPARAWEP